MTTTPEKRTATLSELVAEEIRALMGRRRMTQAQLARGISKTEMWVSLRLRGRQPLDMNDLFLIAQALEVGVHDLLPPPEIAAGAAGPQAIAQYLGPTEATTSLRTRPPDNRPTGHPAPRAPIGARRTAYLPRSGRPPLS
jgi:transcriptional regulator with XRE-family HTH domain